MTVKPSERPYGERLWDRVPVCLATIPFAMGYRSAAVPREYWSSGRTFALERNPDLVAQYVCITQVLRSIAESGFKRVEY